MEKYEDNGLLHEMFLRQAQTTPDAIAVVDADGNQLTFAELDRLSEILALNLRHKGVVPDTCVAIYMDKCIEYVISYIAILRAGGAYLPLDISYPDLLLQDILKDADPVSVVTDEKFSKSVKGMFFTIY
jgi:non-ribosomal peptide synthetase component F